MRCSVIQRARYKVKSWLVGLWTTEERALHARQQVLLAKTAAQPTHTLCSRAAQ